MKRLGYLLLGATWVAAAWACSSSDSSSGGSSGAAAQDGGGGEASSDAGTSGTQCSKQREKLLNPIPKVSTGEVMVVSQTGSTKVLYVDASAGGTAGAATRPRTYVNLERGARVDVSDPDSLTSTDWDLALKRTVIYTNGGEGGPGQGAAIQLAKGFSSVTAADLDKATPEKFFDADCVVLPNPIGDPPTTFADWYNYDQATNIPTPRTVTYGVVGGTGKKYKVAIESYSAQKDGGVGSATGIFLVKVEAL